MTVSISQEPVLCTFSQTSAPLVQRGFAWLVLTLSPCITVEAAPPLLQQTAFPDSGRLQGQGHSPSAVLVLVSSKTQSLKQTPTKKSKKRFG